MGDSTNSEKEPPVSNLGEGHADADAVSGTVALEVGGQAVPVVLNDGEGTDAEVTHEQDGHRIKIPELLPILPVRDAVAFPGTLIPLTIGRDKAARLIDAVIAGAKLVGIVAQRKGEVEDPGLEDLYRVGTVATVLKLLKMPDGTQSIVVHGLMRFGIETLVQTEPYWVARTHSRPDVVNESTEMDAIVHRVREQATRLIALSPNVPDEAQVILGNIEKPSTLADFLAANVNLDLVGKQELLETFDVQDRLHKVSSALAKQLDVLDLSAKIEKEVKDQIDKTQREYYLQEQMRAIQKELGEGDARGVELEELRERIKEAKMPENVQREADRELTRMERIPQASPEYGVARDYLEWLCELPWSVSTEDKLDIDLAAKVLDEDHYDLEKIKKRILEYLAVRKLNPTGKGPILCFAGPPGVGKTSLGQSIARALGRRFIRVALGGVRDEADVRGHRKTYIGSMPGRVIQEIRKVGSNNPVMMLDEVDKIGQDFRGDPSSALLEVLDPHQNHNFQDHYLGVPFDLSKVMFIATANYIDAIPGPLLDRMEIINLSGYTTDDKLYIAKRYLVKRQLKENGLMKETAARPPLKFEDGAILSIIEGYTREAGVRNLERNIGAVCRGIAAEHARGAKIPSVVRRIDIPAYLGPIKFEPELALRTSTPGVATGLAWTPVGGDILFVEATSMVGKGGLTLTGQIGNVMRESAQAAFSLARAESDVLGIDPKALAERDIHVHVPAGAIPKDGPSAGTAMFTAMVSLLKDVPCRSDVAMTGEITLRGLVLPIGGLKEKALAAHRAGIKIVIIPEKNKKDLEEIPVAVRDKLQFVLARRVDDVLNAALKGGWKAIRAAKPTKPMPALRVSRVKRAAGR